MKNILFLLIGFLGVLAPKVNAQLAFPYVNNSPIIYAQGCAFNILTQACIGGGGGGGATWGSITGTLSSQTDLQNALNLKANIASPTFTGLVTIPSVSGLVVTTAISSATTGGSVAGINYVYLATGAMTFTLPTAVGNTNVYDIKKLSTGTLSIATTSSQTIEGSVGITVTVPNTSLTITSNQTNWIIK